MKIFLPFKIKDIGGTSTFAQKFKDGMEGAGHEVSFDYIADYDVLFLIVQCPFKYLLDAKKRGKKIVQRLDGTYYWSVSGWKFPIMNAKAAYIRHFFTDFTIYQSHYSLDCANRFLGPKKKDNHSIVYNGVDLELFSPSREKKELQDSPEQTVFFTASAFRRSDQILPILEGLTRYREKYGGNCKLVVAGTFIGKVKGLPEVMKKMDFVHVLGKVSNKELPSYERSADVFLFTHLNPPCPNNIIESLACGLPICGIADGAMPEIVPNKKCGRLVSVVGTGFWRKRLFDSDVFADNLFQVVQNKNNYCRMSREVAKERFSLEKMINQYLKIFEGLNRG